jgi:hypothetical protein
MTANDHALILRFNDESNRLKTLTFPDIWLARSTELYQTSIEQLRPRFNTIADQYETEGEKRIDAAVGALGYLSWHSVTEVVENYIAFEGGKFTDFLNRFTAPLLVEHFVMNDLVNERITGNIPATAEEASGPFDSAYADGGTYVLDRLVSILREKFMDDLELFISTTGAVFASMRETKSNGHETNAARKAAEKARRKPKKKK